MALSDGQRHSKYASGHWGICEYKKNNEKGRLREKLLGKLGLFVKFFFPYSDFFLKGEILYPYTDR